MNVTLAKSAGFCFGVKRAINTVYEQIELGKSPIYTYGPIIHNEEVVKDLGKKGVQVVNDINAFSSLEKGTVVIRSHGISANEQSIIEASGMEIVDLSCPFVKKIHRIVAEHSALGEYIVIIGDPSHPEVQGIMGWVSGKDVIAIPSKEAAEGFSLSEKRTICIVAQTTFNLNKFKELVEIISEKGYDIIVLNTICNATEERQTEAREIARKSDAMVVIGGRSSSNTQKLFEICKKECENTYYIQTSNDMNYDLLRSFNNVGITAGASTPNNIIEEVSKNVRNEL